MISVQLRNVLVIKPGTRFYTFRSNLVEVVIIIAILAVLAATGLSRLARFERDANIAALQRLKGSLETAASVAATQCRLVQGCYRPGWSTTEIEAPDGDLGLMFNGHPTSGSASQGAHITQWVDVEHFFVSSHSGPYTDFTLERSPADHTCRVRYIEARSPAEGAVVRISTLGC